jgi:hypothetical protein
MLEMLIHKSKRKIEDSCLELCVHAKALNPFDRAESLRSDAPYN